MRRISSAPVYPAAPTMPTRTGDRLRLWNPEAPCDHLSATRASRCDARIALGVLEALAGAGLTVLLALLLARVAREEAGVLEAAAALGIDRDERAGDAVAHGLGLGAVPAAATVAVTSYWSSTSMSSSDWRMIMRDVSRSKYSSPGTPLTWNWPEPGLSQTRATAVLRLPVAYVRFVRCQRSSGSSRSDLGGEGLAAAARRGGGRGSA